MKVSGHHASKRPLWSWANNQWRCSGAQWWSQAYNVSLGSHAVLRPLKTPVALERKEKCAAINFGKKVELGVLIFQIFRRSLLIFRQIPTVSFKSSAHRYFLQKAKTCFKHKLHMVKVHCCTHLCCRSLYNHSYWRVATSDFHWCTTRLISELLTLVKGLLVQCGALYLNLFLFLPSPTTWL